MRGEMAKEMYWVVILYVAVRLMMVRKPWAVFEEGVGAEVVDEIGRAHV